MDKIIDYPIVTGYNRLQSPFLNPTSLTNAYVFLDSHTGRRYISHCMGHDEGLIVGSGPTIRAQYVFKDEMYVVSGDSVYRLDSGLVPNEIGQITTSTGYVGIASNETQVAFVDGAKIWIWDTVASSFTEPTSTFVPPNPSDVTSLDGYLIVIREGTSEWFLSELNNGLNWEDADNVARKALFLSIKGDVLRGIQNVNGHIFLFGDFSIRIWFDAGRSGNIPFREIPNILYEHGLASKASLAQEFGLLVYLSKNKNGLDGVKVSVQGATPQNISTQSINILLEDEFGDGSDAQGFLYRERGDVFYQLSSSTADKTLLYNFSSKEWSILEENDGRHIGATHAFFNNKHYIGGYNVPRIYDYAHEYTSNGLNSIKIQLIGPEIEFPGYEKFKVSQFQLQIVPGLGKTVEPNIYPQVFLALSRDGGITFGNFVKLNSGEAGNYQRRLRWRQLGDMRSFVPKLEYFNDIPFFIKNASIAIDRE